MASITSANAAMAIVKLVASQALPALEPAMLMAGLVNRDYEAALASQGDTINIPIPGSMVANNIAEGGTVKTQNPSLGNAQVVLNKHIEASFVIPDVTKVLATPALLGALMEPAVIAVATQVETDLLGLYASLTANAAVGTGGAGLGSESVIDQAEQALFNAYVPPNAQKFMVVGSSAYGDLRQVDRFTENLTNGDGSAITTGTVGALKGFRIYRSQLVPNVGGTTYNIAFTKNAFALVTRQLPTPMAGTGAIATYVNKNGFGLRVTMSYDKDTLSQQFTVDILYGTGVLRNVFGIPVLS